jgi:nitric oxide reductase subunit B
MSYRKLWLALGLVLTISFAILGGVGIRALKSAPPIPSEVVTSDGRVLFTGSAIQDGQNVWQSIGGQEVGTIWGHGSYVAPDWSADWLHRECVFIFDKWAPERRAMPLSVQSSKPHSKPACGRRCGLTLTTPQLVESRLTRCGPRRSMS